MKQSSKWIKTTEENKRVPTGHRPGYSDWGPFALYQQPSGCLMSTLQVSKVVVISRWLIFLELLRHSTDTKGHLVRNGETQESPDGITMQSMINRELTICWYFKINQRNISSLNPQVALSSDPSIWAKTHSSFLQSESALLTSDFITFISLISLLFSARLFSPGPCPSPLTPSRHALHLVHTHAHIYTTWALTVPWTVDNKLMG